MISLNTLAPNIKLGWIFMGGFALTIYADVVATDVKGLKPHPGALPNVHPPGEVDKPELVPFIVADLTQLGGIVVDETSAELKGQWQYSTHTPPYVGLGYLHDLKQGKGDKSVIYTPNLPKAGRYEVRIAHCYNARRATNTPVTIHHRSGESRIILNQQETPSIRHLWKSLGIFDFNQGTEGWVRISNENTEGLYVIADAIQWIPVSPEASVNELPD